MRGARAHDTPRLRFALVRLFTHSCVCLGACVRDACCAFGMNTHAFAHAFAHPAFAMAQTFCAVRMRCAWMFMFLRECSDSNTRVLSKRLRHDSCVCVSDLDPDPLDHPWIGASYAPIPTVQDGDGGRGIGRGSVPFLYGNPKRPRVRLSLNPFHIP